jgi:GT2 family glycosyltransferase
MIEIITATRLAEAEFASRAPLALSLKRMLHDPSSAHLLAGFEPDMAMRLHVAFSNSSPLADVYNPRITAADAPDDILVFVHDDVWLDDYFFSTRLREGLAQYDVLGIAGGLLRSPNQVDWWGDWQGASGRVAHGDGPSGRVEYFGACPAECDLLDGVFLAARRSVLQASGALFDRRFDFHLYDLDFCRTAKSRGLRVGTWPIALTHRSHGEYGARWAALQDIYLAKWGR